MTCTRGEMEIWLIGHENYFLRGAKLPSIKQVLECYFYHRNIEKIEPDEAKRIAIKKCEVFWLKAGIRIKERHHSAEKLDTILKEWKNLWKSRKKPNFDTSAVHIFNKFKFTDKLDDLFDIAHQTALHDIKDEYDIKNVLLDQRKKRRPGFLACLNDIYDGSTTNMDSSAKKSGKFLIYYKLSGDFSKKYALSHPVIGICRIIVTNI